MEPQKDPPFPSKGSLWPWAFIGILFSSLAYFASRRNQSSESDHTQETAKANGSSIPNADFSVIPDPATSENSISSHHLTTPWWKLSLEVLATFIALGLLIVNIVQSCATRKAADATKSAAQTAARQLELAERPWLTSTVSVASDLTYDDLGGHLTLHYVVENIGNSPAISVVISPELYPTTRLDSFYERRRICTDSQASKSSFGYTIFPKRPVEVYVSITMAKQDMAIASKAVGNSFLPVDVVDCIGYRTSFNDSAYYIGNIYQLGRLPDFLALIPNQLVPRSNLGIMLRQDFPTISN